MARARLILIVLWAGSLWTIGLLVAPTLFATLDDPALAGRLAARFFAIETYISIVAAALWWLPAAAFATRSRALALTIAAILCVMHFGVAPMLGRIAWAHSLAAGLYLLACGLAVPLVLTTRSRAE